MAARVPSPATGVPHEPHEGAALLTGEQISAINRFPDDNPNPVLRFDGDGHLIYANPASAGVLKALDVSVGGRLSAAAIARFEAAVPGHGFVELVADNRTYAVWPVPIPEMGFTNLYGTDVTAERAVVKFPDQNPNPVLRMSELRTWVESGSYDRILRGEYARRGEPDPAYQEDLREAAQAYAEGARDFMDQVQSAAKRMGESIFGGFKRQP